MKILEPYSLNNFTLRQYLQKLKLILNYLIAYGQTETILEDAFTGIYKTKQKSILI